MRCLTQSFNEEVRVKKQPEMHFLLFSYRYLFTEEFE